MVWLIVGPAERESQCGVGGGVVTGAELEQVAEGPHRASRRS